MDRPFQTFLVVLALVCGVVCPARAGAPVVALVTGSPGLGDKSFNDMAYAGVAKAQAEFGFDLIVLEPKAGDVRDVAERADLIVLLGGQHREIATEAARAHPDKKFVMVDVAVEGVSNMSSVLFSQHEGAFLVGALAASVSATGRIGFVGGAKIPPVEAFERGYREGAAYVNPTTAILVDYASPADDFSGFDDPEKGARLAQAHYAAGADIVFAAAGRTGLGVIEAARRAGRLAIGVDSDQDALAEGYVLTSLIKRLDTATYSEIRKVMENAFTPGPNRYGLADGGVRLSDMAYTRDKVPDAVMRRLDEIREGIVSGKITVTDLVAGR